MYNRGPKRSKTSKKDMYASWKLMVVFELKLLHVHRELAIVLAFTSKCLQKIAWNEDILM